MRALPYILIALGLYLLAGAGYDEYRGITRKPASLMRAPGETVSNHAYLYRIPVERDQNPKLFHQFIVTHWIYAVLVESVGCALLLINLQQRNP